MRGSASSYHSVRLGAVENLNQRLKKSLYLKALLQVVDRAEGARSHAALDLLRGVGRVHLEVDRDVGIGAGHWAEQAVGG